MSSGNNSGQNKKFAFIGMRVIKTLLAVHTCFIVAFIRGKSPLYSVFSAIVSMKSDTSESIDTGFSRIIGNIIGGIFGFITLMIIKRFNILAHSYLHYTLLNILLIPVIYASVHLYSPSATTISCITFIGIAIADTVDISITNFALERVFETSLGVLISVVINSII